jgi:AraC family transcriptional regulator, regulatory protein of adaptative response / DNA-3-methyladenine glycosylase II
MATTEAVLRLVCQPPYDWAHSLAFLARRALAGVERVDAAGYARTLACQDRQVVIAVRPLTGEDALELRVTGAPPSVLSPLESTARRVFGLPGDPARVGAQFAADPLLGPLAARHPGLRIPGAWDPFECAVRAVLGQQVSVAAGRTFAARLVGRCGEPLRGGAEGLTHLFPTPARLAHADLAGLGITTARAAALGSLAQAVLEQRVDFSAPPADVTAALAALPGIGPWTAQYVALRALGEPDAFPHGDWVLRRMAAPPGAPPLGARELAERARRWQPWRGYATIHLWHAAGEPGSHTARGASARTASAAPPA